MYRAQDLALACMHSTTTSVMQQHAVSYLLWLQWWTDPHMLGAAKYVGRQLAIPIVDVLGRAAATLIAGMSIGLLYVSSVHNGLKTCVRRPNSPCRHAIAVL